MTPVQEWLLALAVTMGAVGAMTGEKERGLRAFCLVTFVVSLAALAMVTLLEPR